MRVRLGRGPLSLDHDVRVRERDRATMGNRRFAGATVIRRAAQRRLLAYRIGIQALVAHPKEAHSVLAAGDTGLFVSREGGARWERTSANGALTTIWLLTIDPVDPDILLPAPVRPGSIAREMGDGSGRNWLWRLPGSAPLAHPS